MRRILLATLALLLSAALVAAPIVAARGEHHDADDDHDDARESHRADKAANKTRDNVTKNMTAERENRTADREAFRAIMDSWHENATKIRETCKAFDQKNATKEERKEARHCVRDGYRAWWGLHIDDLRALFKSMGHRHGRDG